MAAYPHWHVLHRHYVFSRWVGRPLPSGKYAHTVTTSSHAAFDVTVMASKVNGELSTWIATIGCQWNLYCTRRERFTVALTNPDVLGLGSP